MWTIDARCSRCTKKEACLDRPELISHMSALCGQLNGAPFTDGPGDGILIVACHDFEAL